jgi:large subunit ribosomal protein L23
MTETKNNENSNIAYKILVAPWITEAASVLAEANKFVFKVVRKATKPQIRQAIENLYKVKVLSVKIINIPSKKRMRGKVEGRKSGVKKAIVTLKEGDTINIYEGK